MRQLRIFLIFFLLTMFVLTSTLIPTVEAKMIDTDTYVSVQQYQDGKMQISEFISRDDVRAKLVEFGVDPLEAEQRIAHLSTEEVQLLQSRIADLPAGAGVIEVIGIVFVILLILELIGVTNIFTRI